jgi:uncharacterized protein YjbI with pentapeptide repeats
MKVIKPQKLGILTRTFEAQRKHHFAVTSLVYFAFSDPTVPLAEVDMWKFCAPALNGAPLDAGFPKPLGELLLTATAYPPKPPAIACSVRAQLGRVDKTLWVVGDRTWERGVASSPAPFESMPLSYARAFGGEGFADNPEGKGFNAPEGGALPNLEDPRAPLRRRGDRPAPACFGPIDSTWPARASKLGTYDQDWFENLFPGFARDFDPRFFNAAPADQQLVGFVAPGERFVLENLHPDKHVIEGRIPSFAARVFLQRRGATDLEEVQQHIDTVHLFPAAERGVVLYRGVVSVLEDDGSDVAFLLAALEDADSPKALSHYEQVFANRVDKKKGHLYALRDRDLLPASAASAAADEATAEMQSLLAREGAVEANMRRRAQAELDRARESLRAQGLDPDAHAPKELPPPEPAPSLDELPETIERAMALAEEQKREAETRRQAAEEDARRACRENGLDYDKLAREAREQQGGPPKFTAEGQLEQLRESLAMARNGGVELPHVEAMLADPKLLSKLKDAEARTREVYERFAHHFPVGPRVREEDAARLRREVIAARDAGASLSGRDLTGADLSDLDLRGLELRHVFLEGANLTGADLSGADLSHSVLVRADLTKAQLEGAQLHETNFGEAMLEGATLDDADLTRAVLAKATLTSASFRRTTITGADFSGAVFHGSDFTEASGRELLFLECDLAGVCFAGADLRKSNFLKSSVAGADFSNATLISACFVEAKGDGASFRDANLENLRVVMGCSFNDADFREARMMSASLRGAALSGCDFSDANLRGADFSECDLERAKLYRADAKGARFVKANLSDAVFTSANLMNALAQRATLHGADLRSANLFRADLLRAKVDGRTNIADAELTDLRFIKEASAHGHA